MPPVTSHAISPCAYVNFSLEKQEHKNFFRDSSISRLVYILNVYLDADSDDNDIESEDVYIEEYFEEFFSKKSTHTERYVCFMYIMCGLTFVHFGRNAYSCIRACIICYVLMSIPLKCTTCCIG